MQIKHGPVRESDSDNFSKAFFIVTFCCFFVCFVFLSMSLSDSLSASSRCSPESVPLGKGYSDVSLRTNSSVCDIPKTWLQAEDVTLCLKALVPLPQDPSLVLRIFMVAHDPLNHTPGDPVPFPDL